MKHLFEKTKINQVELKNRFVRSATWEGLANPDGSCGEELTDLVVNLAKGGLGLIINSAAYVNPAGQSGIRQLGIHHDHLIDSYKKMVEEVHEEGSKFFLQIAHAGGKANIKSKDVLPIGPSSLKIAGYISKEMTTTEIAKTIEDFTNAAIRAEKAGFDGIQLHGAHATLLSQFLSPYFNRRKDRYGGYVENRIRIILEILKAIRSALGRKFTVTIKLNSDDYIKGGFIPSEMLQVSTLLEREGIDAIEISGGTTLSISKYTSSRISKDHISGDDVYYFNAAKLYKKKISVPLILVGGIRSLEVARELVEKEEVDYISLCRPLIREPNLIKRWQSGNISRATCISCNKCYIPAKAGEGIYCVLDK